MTEWTLRPWRETASSVGIFPGKDVYRKSAELGSRRVLEKNGFSLEYAAKRRLQKRGGCLPVRAAERGEEMR